MKERIKKALSSRTADRIAKAVIRLCAALVILVSLHFCNRVLICDHFVISGASMKPTLMQGQKVWVKKYLMGPRIYTRFKFGKDEPLRSFRLPGLRRMQAGDIAIFNSPEGWGKIDTVSFQLNFVFAKRCLGAPGDTIKAKDCHYSSSGADPVGIPVEAEEMLRSISDSTLNRYGSLEAGRFAQEQGHWTIRDFGPLVVPARGMTVKLDSVEVQHYAKAICYETGIWPEWRDNQTWISKTPVIDYTFQKDWYFFVGDNIADSRDSRYFGFIPEDYVIGIITKKK
jgi:signal peptidase I